MPILYVTFIHMLVFYSCARMGKAGKPAKQYCGY